MDFLLANLSVLVPVEFRFPIMFAHYMFIVLLPIISVKE